MTGPTGHAKFSPSSAERWISCPASITFAPKFDRGGSSVYAAEGTAAHALAEIRASLAFGKISGGMYLKDYARWTRTYPDLDDATVAEMTSHADAYVEVLKERVAAWPDSTILFEQRLPTGIDGCWGTSDAVVVSPRHVGIVDFKYGLGVAVEAEGNPQLRLYGLAALRAYGYLLGEIETVEMTVHQPRIRHLLTATMTPAELEGWVSDEVEPAVLEALGPEPNFGPSEAACRWCPAAGRCRAQIEFFTREDFGSDPAEISPEEAAETFARIPGIKAWLAAFEKATLDRAYGGGETIPGYKVVWSGGKRTVTDADAAIHAVTADGYDDDSVVRRSIRPIGELEKLLGKADFERLVGPYVEKTGGREALVPEDDRRPAISPASEAAKDFEDES